MSLKYALLAMLDFEKSSGYGLAKRFDKSMGFFWTASFQQIYRELHKLEKEEFVKSEAIAQMGKPDKNIYEMTTAGEQALQTWMSEPTKEMMLKDPLLIKLFAAKHTTKSVLLHELEVQQGHHSAKLSSYRGISSMLENLKEPAHSKYRMVYHTLQLGIRIEQTWLDWAEEMKREIQSYSEVLE